LDKHGTPILHGRHVTTATIRLITGIQADPVLHIRTATEPLDISQLRTVLNEEHYLQAGRPAGHVLWQGVYQQNPEDGRDELVAVLSWARAAKRLKDRDTWIGWDAVKRQPVVATTRIRLHPFIPPSPNRRKNPKPGMPEIEPPIRHAPPCPKTDLSKN